MMQDRPTIQERYGVAASAGQLDDDMSRARPVDVITAVAHAAGRHPLGAALWMLRYAGHRASFGPARRELALQAWRLAVRRKWRMRRMEVELITHRLLQWYAFGHCDSCEGRRFMTLPQAPQILSDQVCASCRGEGHPPIERVIEPDLLRYAKTLHVVLCEEDAAVYPIVVAHLSGRATTAPVARLLSRAVQLHKARADIPGDDTERRAMG